MALVSIKFPAVQIVSRGGDIVCAFESSSSIATLAPERCAPVPASKADASGAVENGTMRQTRFHNVTSSITGGIA